MTYFACNHLKADASAMITASHNPKEYNGAKFTREKAIPISEDTGIKEMEKKVNAEDFKHSAKKGAIIKKEIKNAYKNHILSFAKEIKNLKVVVDCANGMGSQDFSIIQDELDIRVVPLYFEIDGTFPNHDANPMKEGSTDMLKKRFLRKSRFGNRIRRRC
jgi:phosphomannomutase